MTAKCRFSLTMASNRLLTREDVEAILNRDGCIGDGGTWLSIQSLDFYQRAFVHRSFVIKGDPELAYVPDDCNDVYEWAGDKCLGFCTSTYLTRRFPSGNACFLTNIFKSLIRGTALHRFARYHNFGRFILFSPRTEYSAPHTGLGHINIYEDAFEAFIEAIVRDFGVDAGQRYARRFLIATIERCMDFAQLLGASDNHKQAVQKVFQSHKLKSPGYIDMPGPRNWYVKVIVLTSCQLKQLPPALQTSVSQYHQRIMAVLRRYAGSRCIPLAHGTFVVGMGRGTKKSIAEQCCSKTALSIMHSDNDLC